MYILSTPMCHNHQRVI